MTGNFWDFISREPSLLGSINLVCSGLLALSIINKHFRGWKSVIWQLRFSKNFKKFIHKRRAIKPAGLFLITLQKKGGYSFTGNTE
jgi:hypothetical protein